MKRLFSYTVHGVVLAFCLSSLTSSVDAAPKAKAKDAFWHLTRNADPKTGAFDYCATESSFSNGLSLAFARNADFFTNIVVGFSQPKLEKDTKYPLSLIVDQNAPIEVTGFAADPTALVIPLKRNEQLIAALAKGSVLDLKGPRDSVRFSLQGAGDALDKLQDCVERSIAEPGAKSAAKPSASAGTPPATIASANSPRPLTLPDTTNALNGSMVQPLPLPQQAPITETAPELAPPVQMAEAEPVPPAPVEAPVAEAAPTPPAPVEAQVPEQEPEPVSAPIVVAQAEPQLPPEPQPQPKPQAEIVPPAPPAPPVNAAEPPLPPSAVAERPPVEKLPLNRRSQASAPPQSNAPAPTQAPAVSMLESAPPSQIVVDQSSTPLQAAPLQAAPLQAAPMRAAPPDTTSALNHMEADSMPQVQPPPQPQLPTPAQPVTQPSIQPAAPAPSLPDISRQAQIKPVPMQMTEAAPAPEASPEAPQPQKSSKRNVYDNVAPPPPAQVSIAPADTTAALNQSDEAISAPTPAPKPMAPITPPPSLPHLGSALPSAPPPQVYSSSTIASAAGTQEPIRSQTESTVVIVPADNPTMHDLPAITPAAPATQQQAANPPAVQSAAPPPLLPPLPEAMQYLPPTPPAQALQPTRPVVMSTPIGNAGDLPPLPPLTSSGRAVFGQRQITPDISLADLLAGAGIQAQPHPNTKDAPPSYSWNQNGVIGYGAEQSATGTLDSFALDDLDKRSHRCKGKFTPSVGAATQSEAGVALAQSTASCVRGTLSSNETLLYYKVANKMGVIALETPVNNQNNAIAMRDRLSQLLESNAIYK